MIMFKRILVPLDGSTRAERALPIAARIARAADGSVILVQVATLPATYSTYLASSAYTEAIETELKNAEDYLNALANSELLAGIETETKALFGAVAQTILSVACSYSADLIVMSSQGKTGLKRWVLGSVAQKIARHSPLPVFVLHEGGPLPARPQPDAHHPLQALVTLDGSALAKAALEPAAKLVAALSSPAKGALHLLRVVKPPVLDVKGMEGDQEYIERLKENALHKAKTYLNSVADNLREGPLADLKLSITWSVAIDDDVAHAIIHMAENGEDAEGAGVFGRCDLIAMATHGRGGFQHWVLGSVTERVLGATKLPILVIRPEETEFQRAFSNGGMSEAQIQTKVSLF